MAPFYLKPENAIKRADELIGLNEHQQALSLLHEFILSKRFRLTPIAQLEPILIKFIDLSVLLRKGKTAKEALHQYKNISQNVAITTIEVVIKRFIDLSEQKVQEAQAKSEQLTVESLVDDLEALETPESILLNALSSSTDADVAKDRTDRELVTPWLKFLWESYRTALEILRNNSRLEVLYQSIANQAFQFCLKYLRKTEFRRLCEILRQHLSIAEKYAHQQHSINFSESDTLQRHLDTRFVQLNAAVDLELWQEAFRSIEDINSLYQIFRAKNAKELRMMKKYMLANYYEKLVTIFLVGENYLYHAAARYLLFENYSNSDDDERERMASLVLISALCIPIISSLRTKSYSDMDDTKANHQRLANLLMMPVPSREILLSSAVGKKELFGRVSPELRELYNILEVDFNPLSICKNLNPILATLSSNKTFLPYLKPLKYIILTRLVQQLSQVFTTIKIDSVVRLFNEAFEIGGGFTAFEIEKFILAGCRKGNFFIQINHQNNCFTFIDSSAITKEADQLLNAKFHGHLSAPEQVRFQLAKLADDLAYATGVVDGGEGEKKKDLARREAVDLAIKMSGKEREKILFRLDLIQKKKEMEEVEKEKQSEKEAIIRKQAQKEAAEAEKVRMDNESKRREEERLKVQKALIEQKEKEKLALKLSTETSLRGKSNKLNLKELDTEQLMELHMQQLDIDQREMKQKLRLLARKLDHFERAKKKEEISLLEKDYENQKKVDRAYHVAFAKAKLEAAEIKHEQDLRLRERFGRMVGDATIFGDELFKGAEVRNDEKKRVAGEGLRIAKEKRVKEFNEKVEAERKAKEKFEKKRLEDEKKRVEDEKKRMDEDEKIANEKLVKEQERKEQEAQKRKEADERRLKLDEQFKKQQERERLAEEKIRSQKNVSEMRTGSRESSGGGSDGWRRPEESSLRNSPSSSSVRSTGVGGERKFVSRGAPRGETGGRDAPRESERPPARGEDDGGGWRRAGDDSRSSSGRPAGLRDAPPTSSDEPPKRTFTSYKKRGAK